MLVTLVIRRCRAGVVEVLLEVALQYCLIDVTEDRLMHPPFQQPDAAGLFVALSLQRKTQPFIFRPRGSGRRQVGNLG
jgi:hypothetical protein